MSRETEAKLAELNARRAEEPPAAPAQLMLGGEAAQAEGGAGIDIQATYADWLRAAAQRKDPLRNPAGHWIDFCKRRAQQQKGAP